MSDPPLLRRTAAVVRNRRDVDDVGDLVAERIQGTHRRLAARTRALDAHFQRLDAVIQRHAPSLLRRDLRGERRGLARTAETCPARGRPRQCIALTIGDGNDGVVEGSLDVGDAVNDDALGLLLRLGSWFVHGLSGWKMLLCNDARPSRRARHLFLDGATRALAGACVGAGALAARRQATAMTQTAIGTQIHQALDADADLAAQVAFHGELRHFAAQVLDLALGQRLDLRGRIDARRFADLARAGTADAEDALQAYPDVLVDWQVDACDTCHVVGTPPEMRCRFGKLLIIA